MSADRRIGERLPEPTDWIVARSFPDRKSAVQAWKRVRDYIRDTDMEASVFRFKITLSNVVAIIGEGSLDGSNQRNLDKALGNQGQLIDAPEHIVRFLQDRRFEFRMDWPDLTYLEKELLKDLDKSNLALR